jgi:sterol desaturase/sphingolipid hydroxylase (fatty acid hydroxylase superfamily)
MPLASPPELLRPAFFFGILAALLVAERVWPRRAQPMQRRMRWTSNFGLVILDTAVLALLPLAALGTALWAEAAGIGLFNVVAWPAWLEVALAWLLLDAAIYVQHRAMHEIPLLWRLHRVHHSDIEFDTTTGVRFHPLEILLSMGWKMGLVAALGAPLLAVLILEITLSGFALWSHANLRYPLLLDRWLRRVVITPEVHRVHHSPYTAETNSNYGSALIIWDHLFRSYVAQPREGHRAMRIGLDRWRAAGDQRLTALLRQPLE